LTSARQVGPAELECQGTFEAAGQARPVTFNAHIAQATARAVVLTAELPVDRAALGMTWSPPRMASMSARGTVTARFTRP
jgi:polyisoprenoid-binding protein YceI